MPPPTTNHDDLAALLIQQSKAGLHGSWHHWQRLSRLGYLVRLFLICHVRIAASFLTGADAWAKPLGCRLSLQPTWASPFVRNSTQPTLTVQPPSGWATPRPSYRLAVSPCGSALLGRGPRCTLTDSRSAPPLRTLGHHRRQIPLPSPIQPTRAPQTRQKATRLTGTTTATSPAP